MINRIYKIINIKFPRLLKFVFFLRYLFLVFFTSLTIFLTIPNFFDFKKSEGVIRSYFLQNYKININKIDNIKYNFFPLPHLELRNFNAKLFSKETSLNTEKTLIYPNLKNIYNFKNLEIKKTIFLNSEIKVDYENFNQLKNNIFQMEEKIKFENSNIKIKNKNDTILNFKKINFSNYGYKKNKINGEVFEKKFEVKSLNNFKKINFKLLDVGILVSINIIENNQASKIDGNFKAKLLKSNLKSDFSFGEKSINFSNLVFRDKNLSFDSSGFLNLKPYVSVNFDTKILDLNRKLFNTIDLKSIFKHKEILKRINSNSTFSYNSKRFSINLLESLIIKTNLAYGRLNFIKQFSISNSNFQCLGDVNLLDDYPVVDFDCSVISEDKRKLFKKFDVDYKIKNEKFNLKIKGNLNVLNNKINFDHIKLNNNYNIPEDDLKFLKKSFEDIIFNKDFLSIFDLSKVSKFLNEIS